jgi:hypothetical protein
LNKKEYNTLYYLKNKEIILKNVKDYQQNNKQKIKLRKRNHYLLNQKEIKEKACKYYENNKENILKQHKSVQHKTNEYMRNKRKTDINFKISQRIRCRTRFYIKNKEISTQELVGCDWKTLKIYLENQFKDGMCWENMHLWEIDHIKPLSKFNLENLDEQKKAAHYTNLQPLYMIDNRKKKDKY